MTTLKQHEQALVNLGRLAAALYPTDADLRGAINQCLATYGEVEKGFTDLIGQPYQASQPPSEGFKMPIIQPVWGPRK